MDTIDPRTGKAHMTPWWNWAILVLGIGILLLSVLADALGLGQAEGFGWKQTLGVLVGLVLVAVGYYLHCRRT